MQVMKVAAERPLPRASAWIGMRGGSRTGVQLGSARLAYGKRCVVNYRIDCSYKASTSTNPPIRCGDRQRRITTCVFRTTGHGRTSRLRQEEQSKEQLLGWFPWSPPRLTRSAHLGFLHERSAPGRLWANSGLMQRRKFDVVLRGAMTVAANMTSNSAEWAPQLHEQSRGGLWPRLRLISTSGDWSGGRRNAKLAGRHTMRIDSFSTSP